MHRRKVEPVAARDKREAQQRAKQKRELDEKLKLFAKTFQEIIDAVIKTR